MSIKRYTANKDTTITNAFKPNNLVRATGSNMGLTDSMEIFSLYGHQASGSTELSRALLQFPITDLSTDRTNGDLPVSGSVNFYLRMFNAEHPFTLPKEYTLSVFPMLASWEEGHGVDADEYSHVTYDKEGANWVRREGVTSWTEPGGDFDHNSEFVADFNTGEEDLEIDITSLVEDWIAGTVTNNGLMLKLSGTYEATYTGSADGIQVINTTGS
jgi:hypothetical protein